MLGFIPLMILFHINRVFYRTDNAFFKRRVGWAFIHTTGVGTDLELYQLAQTRVDDAFNKRGMQNP